MTDQELYHWGIKGMKWGVRKDKNKTNVGYKSTGIKSALARRSNKNVDKSFDDWKETTRKRDDAIALGKKANEAKRAYENDRSNKALRDEYRTAQKQYKKALSENTTYRKGVVRQEVGKDASRKYLSDAKKVKKQLDADPSNKDLQKKYNDLMSKHDVERASARRATEVSAKRSQLKANLKRKMTVTVKVAAGAAAIAAGTYAVNRYLSKHNVTINGKRATLGAQNVKNVVDLAKKAKDALGFLY